MIPGEEDPDLDQVWHIYPHSEGGVHDTDGVAGCDCNPRCTVPCIECIEYDDPDPECWKCQGEGVVDAAPDDRPLIVVHSRKDTVKGYLGRLFEIHDSDDDDGPERPWASPTPSF